jgi:hypothetical protein
VLSHLADFSIRPFIPGKKEKKNLTISEKNEIVFRWNFVVLCMG